MYLEVDKFQNSISNLSAMVNFMYQVVWDRKCPEAAQALFLGVSVGVFLKDMSMCISAPSKADGPLQYG